MKLFPSLRKKNKYNTLATILFSFFGMIGAITIIFISTLIIISMVNEAGISFIKSEKYLSPLIELIAVVFSFTAIISILVAIMIEQRRRKSELQETTIKLFQEWRGQHLNKARIRASKNVLKRWDDIEFRNNFFDSMIAIENRKDLSISEEDIQAVSDIIGFYTVLSIYRGNEDDIRNLNYFYYGWWRKMLYDIADFRDTRRDVALANKRKLNNLKVDFNRTEYLDNVKMYPMLQRLDKLCGFQNLPTDFDLGI